MAVSETARLIASLELQDKFSGTSNKALGQLGKLEVVTGRASKGMGLFGHAAATALGLGLERAVSGGIRLLTAGFTAGVEGAVKLEQAQAQTQAALKSTGGVSGQTADSIRALAEQYENLNSVIDDKVIQSAENVLLTFPKIGKAFQPALEASLNLNTALGGGAEGLQGTIIQVGKALQDPIRGLTSLRRVGVAFTEDQTRQIKALVKSNDLYGAQRIILDELATEFGGRFAAQGKTAAGSMAALRDSVEDLEIAGVQGLLPGLQVIRTQLTKTFRDPNTIAAVQNFGKQIGDFITPERVAQAIGIVKGAFQALADVPWGTIGEGLKIAGQATKIAVDAFKSLPGPLQGALIASLAVNKLSGGIVGSLAKGGAQAAGGGIAAAIGKLFGGRGSSPATPIFTKEVGIPGVPGAGPAGPTAGAGGGLISKVFMTGIAAAAGIELGAAIGNAFAEKSIAPARESEAGAFETFTADKQSPAAIVKAINSIDEQLKPSLTDVGLKLEDSGAAIALAFDIGGVKTTLNEQRAALVAKLQEQGLTLDEAKALLAKIDAKAKDTANAAGRTAEATRDSVKTLKAEQADRRAAAAAATRAAAAAALKTAQSVSALAASERADASRLAARSSAIQAAVDRGRAVTGAGLNRIAEKNFSPTVRVAVSSIANISVSSVVRATTSFHIATGGTGGLIEGASL
jgi:hypothetical protein